MLSNIHLISNLPSPTMHTQGSAILLSEVCRADAVLRLPTNNRTISWLKMQKDSCLADCMARIMYIEASYMVSISHFTKHPTTAISLHLMCMIRPYVLLDWTKQLDLPEALLAHIAGHVMIAVYGHPPGSSFHDAEGSASYLCKSLTGVHFAIGTLWHRQPFAEPVAFISLTEAAAQQFAKRHLSPLHIPCPSGVGNLNLSWEVITWPQAR